MDGRGRDRRGLRALRREAGLNESRLRLAYAALVAAAFVGVALWRLDLVLLAARVTARTFARGGATRWKLLGEIVLFCAILAGTWKALPWKPRPARDAAVLLLGLAAGWAAEAWGTRLGLWHYYTGERPPLWIVPAWPLGAALIERLGERARARWGAAPRSAYWAASLAVAAYCLAFSRPWLDRPVGWLGAVAAGAALLAVPEPAEDFWLLAAGLACVFFADLWGTTNGCWAYWLRHEPFGLIRGIAFGMAFDAAVAVGCLRLARRLAGTAV